MPKVIENIEERILEAAESLFSEAGYNDADMRAISKKAGIAVGTLYNYFPDKNTLFIEAFKKSWEKTFSRLDDIIESNDTAHEKLILFVDEVYEGILRRKGIGIQLLIDSLHSISARTAKKSSINNTKGLQEIGKTLQEKARILVNQLMQAQSVQMEEYMINKLADAIMLLVWGAVSQHFQDKAKSISFICDMVEAYIKTYISEHKAI